MTHDEAHRLALALEALRGSVETGFATIRGDINLLARAENHNREDIADLDERVKSLEERKFPLPVVAGIMSFAGVFVSVIALTRGG